MVKGCCIRHADGAEKDTQDGYPTSWSLVIPHSFRKSSSESSRSGMSGGLPRGVRVRRRLPSEGCRVAREVPGDSRSLDPLLRLGESDAIAQSLKGSLSLSLSPCC